MTPLESVTFFRFLDVTFVGIHSVWGSSSILSFLYFISSTRFMVQEIRNIVVYFVSLLLLLSYISC